jgi:predicted nucleotidyltransferase
MLASDTLCLVKVGRLEIDSDRLAAFCEKWGIAELAVFGSVLREDFRPDSDIDFLVTWAPGKTPRFFDMLEMKDQLAQLVGREVDLAQRQVVEKDYNQYRRSAILDSATVLYAAA